MVKKKSSPPPLKRNISGNLQLFCGQQDVNLGVEGVNLTLIFFMYIESVKKDFNVKATSGLLGRNWVSLIYLGVFWSKIHVLL